MLKPAETVGPAADSVQYCRHYSDTTNFKVSLKSELSVAVGSAAAASRQREAMLTHGLVAFGAVMAVLGTIITFLETFTDLLK